MVPKVRSCTCAPSWRKLTESRTDHTMYFGCRSAVKDYYYSDAWEKDAQDIKLLFRSRFPEIRFVKLLCTAVQLNEMNIGQESLRLGSDRGRLGTRMGARRGQGRLGLHLRVHTSYLLALLIW